MKLEKKWKAAYDAVLERVPSGTILFRLTIKLYPTMVWMEDQKDRCSLCPVHWSFIDVAMSHAHGLPHFRQWCIENPARVRELFPEAINVTAEATLTESVEVRRCGLSG